MVAHTLTHSQRPYRWRVLPPESDASAGSATRPSPVARPGLPGSPVRQRSVPTAPAPHRPAQRTTGRRVAAEMDPLSAVAPMPAACSGARPDAGYRMGRWARLAMTLTVAAAAAVAVALWLATPGTAPAVELVTVQSGDTLWSIAVEHLPGADPGTVVDELAALNGLDGGPLRIGSTLQVPVG